MSSTDQPTHHREQAPAGPHVVVVGGGFGGLACAKELGKRGVAVTLIDRNTYHQFQPLLYQVATAQLAGADIKRPLRGLFRKVPTVNVKQGEVASIDPTTHTVTTTRGDRFTGTHLVLAMGARPNFFDVEGAAAHAFPLYSVNDAERLRNRILQVFEDADLHPPRVDQGALNFVIVGGGATGVETAGSLADMVGSVLPQRYHDLDIDRARVYLVDYGHVVLAPFSDKVHVYASDALINKGVELRLGTGVSEVLADRVKLSNGTEIPTRCVVWAGGLQAAHVDGLDELATARGGRIEVGHDLAVEGFPGVYAVGDIANTVDEDGEQLPQLGSVAMQGGSAVANSILADIDGRPAPSFDYRDKGIMAMIGSRAAVAEMGPQRRELRGTLAFLAWLGVHAWLLSTSRARADAFMKWAWDAFSKSRSPAIIDDPDAPVIDWGDEPDAPTASPATAPTGEVNT